MMSLPTDHQKDTQNVSVEDTQSSVHVTSVIRNVKAAALRQAVAQEKIKRKVAANPAEIRGKLVSTMGELQNLTRKYVKVQGREEVYRVFAPR